LGDVRTIIESLTADNLCEDSRCCGEDCGKITGPDRPANQTALGFSPKCAIAAHSAHAIFSIASGSREFSRGMVFKLIGNENDWAAKA
jgi:hypothetical protein